MHWYLTALKKYAEFNGRARRMEFWMFYLFAIIIGFVVGIVDGVIAGAITGVPIFSVLYGLAMIVPYAAVAVRRLHDTDKSGWYLLLAFVPCVGIILLVFWAQEGTRGSNQFGPDPLGGDRRALADSDDEDDRPRRDRDDRDDDYDDRDDRPRRR